MATAAEVVLDVTGLAMLIEVAGQDTVVVVKSFAIVTKDLLMGSILLNLLRSLILPVMLRKRSERPTR